MIIYMIDQSECTGISLEYKEYYTKCILVNSFIRIIDSLFLALINDSYLPNEKIDFYKIPIR